MYHHITDITDTKLIAVNKLDDLIKLIENLLKIKKRISFKRGLRGTIYNRIYLPYNL